MVEVKMERGVRRARCCWGGAGRCGGRTAVRRASRDVGGEGAMGDAAVGDLESVLGCCCCGRGTGAMQVAWTRWASRRSLAAYVSWRR